MTARSIQPTQAQASMPTREVASARQSRSFRRARFLIAPAFVAIALSAAACSSDSPSASSSADALIAQGLKAESNGQTQEAMTDFNAALAKNPASAIAYYDLGTIYQEHLSNPTQAITEYNKALLADPTYIPAMYNLATAQSSSDPQAAIDEYNKIIALSPNDANVLFNLGLLLIAQNQPLPGHADLKKAIAITPSLAQRVPAGITP